MSVFDEWMTHTVDVDTVGADGDWGGSNVTPHADVPCIIEDGTLLVRDASGNEVASSTRLHIALVDAAWFTPGSSVTVRSRVTEVLSVEVVDDDPDLDGATVVLR